MILPDFAIRYAYAFARSARRVRHVGIVHVGHIHDGTWCYTTVFDCVEVDAHAPVTCFWCLTKLTS